jgi:hypothetical protein
MASKKSGKTISSLLAIATGLSIGANALLFRPNNTYALEGEAPKVSASNPSWYYLSNQPASAVFQEREQKNLELMIGRASADINGSSYALDAPPYIKSGRTMVPVRFISEGLGADVAWNASEKKVTINLDGKEVLLYIGKNYGYVAGKKVSLDAPPEIKSGRTMVPVRLISEGFGASVAWDAPTKTVSISKETLGEKTIIESSDADSDGLTFSAEKILGTNPNNRATVYSSLTDGKLSEIKGLYPALNIFARNPDGKTDVSLAMKVSLGADPTNPNNFDDILDDFNAIRYAREKGAAISKQGIEKVISELENSYGPKMSDAFKSLYGAGRIKAAEMNGLSKKIKDVLAPVFEAKFWKIDMDTFETYLDSFSSSDHAAMALVFSQEQSVMAPAIAKAMSRSGSYDFMKNESDFVALLKSFPSLNDGVKTIGEYNIFSPVLAQAGDRWAFSFDIFKNLKASGFDITKASADEKLMFFAYVSGRGPVYEEISNSEKGKTLLSENTAKNFLAWKERKALLKDAGAEQLAKSFLDLGALANPISISYMESKRIEGGFAQIADFSENELASFINDMYGASIDENALKIIEFAKNNKAVSYPRFTDAKTDLFNPADINIITDPFGTIAWGDFYWGVFGKKTKFAETENLLTPKYMLGEISRLLYLGNSVPEEEQIALGGTSGASVTGKVALERIMNLVNDVPVIERRNIDAGESSAFALTSAGTYENTSFLKRQKLKSDPKAFVEEGETALFFNPYLIDGYDLFNYDRCGITESIHYGEYRGIKSIDYLDALPKFEEIIIPVD